MKWSQARTYTHLRKVESLPQCKMLRTAAAADSSSDDTRITLFWSCDYESEFVYRSELDELLHRGNQSQ